MKFISIIRHLLQVERERYNLNQKLDDETLLQRAFHPHLKIISMLAMILAFNAFNSPVRTMQLRQGRAASLCMEAVNILRRMDEIEKRFFL